MSAPNRGRRVLARRRWPWLLAVAGASALAAYACRPEPTGPGATTSARIVFDASPLFAARQAQGGIVTVVDLAELTVVTAPGGVRSHRMALAPGQAEARFEIRVPEGLTTFEARVRSTNGATLFRGSDTVDVRTDFTVDIDLEAVAPVLVVTPDSLRAERPADQREPATFLVENRGAGDLQWTVAGVDPPVDSCGPFDCILLGYETAPVRAGSGVPLVVLPYNTPERVYRIRLGSPQGDVEVKVLADSASVTGTILARVRGVDGSPVVGREVTLLACSAGSRQGDPGFCIPDESQAPRLGSTDAGGTVRFAGLLPGYWRLRPDPTGSAEIEPSAATRFVGPDALVTVDFVAIPIGLGRQDRTPGIRLADMPSSSPSPWRRRPSCSRLAGTTPRGPPRATRSPRSWPPGRTSARSPSPTSLSTTGH